MPLRTFEVPAAYQRHLEASLALVLDEVARDLRARAAGREGVVPDFLVDEELRGTAKAIVVTSSRPSGEPRADGVTVGAAPQLPAVRRLRAAS